MTGKAFPDVPTQPVPSLGEGMGVGHPPQEALPTHTTLPPQGQSLSTLEPQHAQNPLCPSPCLSIAMGMGEG